MLRGLGEQLLKTTETFWRCQTERGSKEVKKTNSNNNNQTISRQPVSLPVFPLQEDQARPHRRSDKKLVDKR